MKKIILASANAHKLKEFKDILEPLGYEVISFLDLLGNIEIVEDGTTFVENALIKARAIRKFTKLPVLSDDSGLMIDALDGFPGVYSARFMEHESYEKKCLTLISRLKNKKKAASFHCALVLIDEVGKEMIFEGEARGLIADTLSGKGGFGYDPMFYSIEGKKRFAEMSEKEKNTYSHRAKAVAKLLAYLNNK